MATPKKRVHVQKYYDVYIVQKLVNTTEPSCGDELSEDEVQQLISEGVEVTITPKK